MQNSVTNQAICVATQYHLLLFPSFQSLLVFTVLVLDVTYRLLKWCEITWISAAKYHLWAGCKSRMQVVLTRATSFISKRKSESKAFTDQATNPTLLTQLKLCLYVANRRDFSLPKITSALRPMVFFLVWQLSNSFVEIDILGPQSVTAAL